MTTDEVLVKMSLLIDELSRISLTQSKVLNSLLDICGKHKERIEELEKDLQDREADIKVLYSKVKDMERDNGKRI